MNAFFLNFDWISFGFISLLFGGWTSTVTGRAVAQAWEPPYRLLPLGLLLAALVRFLHMALTGAPLFAFEHFLLDYLVVMVFALLGYKLEQQRLIKTLYPWLHTTWLHTTRA